MLEYGTHLAPVVLTSTLLFHRRTEDVLRGRYFRTRRPVLYSFANNYIIYDLTANEREQNKMENDTRRLFGRLETDETFKLYLHASVSTSRARHATGN